VTERGITRLDPDAYPEISEDLAGIAAGFEGGGNRVRSMKLTVGFETGTELVIELKRPDDGSAGDTAG
jgi:hypothetical protein